MFRLSKWLCHDKNFAFAFALVQPVAQLFLQWSLEQLFPAAWAGGMGQSGKPF
jgi:hypothetical protein